MRLGEYMNYDTLSVEFLQRYFGLLRTHGRSTAKRYGGKCGKETISYDFKSIGRLSTSEF